MQQILLACSDAAINSSVKDALKQEAEVDWAADPESLDQMLPGKPYDLLIVDLGFLRVPSPHGLEEYINSIDALRQSGHHADIILLVSHDSASEAVKALQAGASSYLRLPLKRAELRHTAAALRDLRRRKSELDFLRSRELEHDTFLHSESGAMQEVFRQIKSIADTKTTTLITGETGVGKGVAARLIHRLSRRKAGPFISLHCGAIPENLFESELFGHEKGAFTGAFRRKPGKLELASSGSVFLDEIGVVSPAIQIKLLNVLQDKVFQRVGGTVDIPVDARVIAATNTDLEQLCHQGLFRRDLFYRLNVFPIHIPPLRTRREDIPLLAGHFLAALNTLYSKSISAIDPAVIEAFSSYAWPGNVRELENVLERAYLLETSKRLRPESFPGELFGSKGLSGLHKPQMDAPLTRIRRQAADKAEGEYLRTILHRYRGRIDKSAAHAGITPRQLNNLLRKHGLNKIEFKNGSAGQIQHGKPE